MVVNGGKEIFLLDGCYMIRWRTDGYCNGSNQCWLMMVNR